MSMLTTFTVRRSQQAARRVVTGCSKLSHAIVASATSSSRPWEPVPAAHAFRSSSMPRISILGVVAAFLITPVAAQALPVVDGETRVVVTADLAGLGLTPSLLGTANLVSAAPLTVSFPITGGELDLDTLVGQIRHDGSGLSLEAGGNTISFTNFIIDTTNPLVTADYLFNGNLVANGGSLFSFDLSSVTIAELTDLAAPALALFFTDASASFLTEVFGAPDLTGAQFGLVAIGPVLGLVEVPAPTAFALFGLSALGLAAARRRRI